MPIPLLQVDHLTLSSLLGPIVQDLSFQIVPGEIVALTGKSGSGKTSIALAILDLLPSGIKMDSGQMTWSSSELPPITFGEDRLHWKSLRGARIGYIQQDVFGAFDPVLRVGAQMMLVIRERTTLDPSSATHNLRQRMEEVGLHDIDRLWTSYPHQLSGGQLQRCQIAMSLVMEPLLLIADEPTSAIDKINQAELLAVFSMLRQRYRMAILCITHEEDVVRLLADREVSLEERSAFSDNTHIPDERRVYPDSPIRLQGVGLMYRHQFGGLFQKAGAVIGPLDFELRQGHCLGIVGESGSGKSTLTRLLVGLLQPSEGRLILDGQEVDYLRKGDLSRLRTRVQLVMQDGRGSLHPELTIRILLREAEGISREMKKDGGSDMHSALASVGLSDAVLDRRAGQLSGGECLRVSIARALILRPEVLICDESTSSLDPLNRDAFLQLLRSLMDTFNMALIFITHDKHIIRQLADEVLVMAEGHVVEKGPARDVISRPTHPVSQKIFNSHATFSAGEHLSGNRSV